MANKAKPNRKRSTHPWHYPLSLRITHELQRLHVIGSAITTRIAHWRHHLQPALSVFRVRARQFTHTLIECAHVGIRWAIPRLKERLKQWLPHVRMTAQHLIACLDPSRVRVETPQQHVTHTVLMTVAFIAILVAAGTVMACSAA